MKTSKEIKPQLEKVQDLIASINIGMLTTQGPENGALYSRPMQAQEMDSAGNLWFFSSEQTDKDYEIKQDSQVNVSFADNGKSNYVSISGTAQVVHDRAKMEELWSPIMKAWYPQGLDTPGISLLKISINTASYWDNASNKMVQLYYLAKALISGGTYEEGDHGKVEG